jgi:hypothetical protein
MCFRPARTERPEVSSVDFSALAPTPFYCEIESIDWGHRRRSIKERFDLANPGKQGSNVSWILTLVSEDGAQAFGTISTQTEACVSEIVAISQNRN